MSKNERKLEAVFLTINEVLHRSTGMKISSNNRGEGGGTFSDCLVTKIIGAVCETLEAVITDKEQLKAVKSLVKERIWKRADTELYDMQTFYDSICNAMNKKSDELLTVGEVVYGGKTTQEIVKLLKD